MLKFKKKFRRLKVKATVSVTEDFSGRAIYGVGLRPLAYWEGSNPARVCVNLARVVSVRYRSLRRADHLSREILRSVVCERVIMKSRQGGVPSSQGAVRNGERGSRNIQWPHPLILYSAQGLHIYVSEFKVVTFLKVMRDKRGLVSDYLYVTGTLCVIFKYKQKF